MPTKRPNRRGVQLHLWVAPAVADSLDAYRMAQDLQPTTTSVIESAVMEFLAARGFWPADHPPRREGADRPPG